MKNVFRSWLPAIFLLCATASAMAAGEPYTLQPGDVLQVSVWKEADLQMPEVLVRTDGAISFPLAGDISVVNISVSQLGDALTEKLKKYIPDPVVTVALKAARGNKIYVVGKVNRPGEFPFDRQVDVTQALSLAGGTTPFAAVNDIRVLRRDNGKQISFEFHYSDIERGKSLEQNIVLRSGDVVVVP